MSPTKKPSKKPSKFPGNLGALAVPVAFVGERKNYNLQPEVTEYGLWPFSTIEWVVAENRYRARAMIQHKTTKDIVAFNSWHQAYADAERVIAALSDSLRGVGERPIYNIMGEVIEVHTADIGAALIVNVIEVLALVWSMNEVVTP